MGRSRGWEHSPRLKLFVPFVGATAPGAPGLACVDSVVSVARRYRSGLGSVPGFAPGVRSEGH